MHLKVAPQNIFTLFLLLRLHNSFFLPRLFCFASWARDWGEKMNKVGLPPGLGVGGVMFVGSGTRANKTAQ